MEDRSVGRQPPAGLNDPQIVNPAWVAVLTGFELRFAPSAVVRHHHRRRVSTLVRQHRRYARGYGRLDGRWSSYPGYRDTAGSPVQRLRALWLLPLRLPYRAISGGPLTIPLIDAAVRLAHEVGRWEGRRQPALPPLRRVPLGDRRLAMSTAQNVRNP